MVGDTTLSNWIQILNQTLANQQAVIDSLQASLASQETQLDSTMIADMIAAAGGLGGGGGCNYAFPEGIEGEVVAWDLGSAGNQNDYTVPSGKNLFITNIHTDYGYNFRINGMVVIDEEYSTSSVYAAMLKLPICVMSGQVISGNIPGSGANTFYGILTDANVEPLTFWFDSDTYTVPIGKKLVVTNLWMTGNEDFTIDGVSFAGPTFNKPSGQGTKHLEIPLIINSESILLVPNQYASFNGYLVDEDYFADCGGGGSSEGGGSQDLVVEFVAIDASCRCWPDQGEVIVNLPNADIVYLEVEPYLSGQTNSDFDTYNCFRFKLPDGTEFKSMTIIPPHLFSLTTPAGSLGDDMDALFFQIYANNFLGHLSYEAGIDSYSWGPHAGWHTWKFIRDHYGNWRPITTQP
jgi:hypothetical protein